VTGCAALLRYITLHSAQLGRVFKYVYLLSPSRTVSYCTLVHAKRRRFALCFSAKVRLQVLRPSPTSGLYLQCSHGG